MRDSATRPAGRPASFRRSPSADSLPSGALEEEPEEALRQSNVFSSIVTSLEALKGAPPPVQSFTLDGSEALELHLAATCDRVKQAIRQHVPQSCLQGLILAGGYGRGEGGVLRTNAGDQAYNDLEFYVFFRGPALLAERLFGPTLHRIGELLSPAAGAKIEFKAITRAKVRRGPTTMFTYDLVARHRRLFGSESLLSGCSHHTDGARIPISEATRLLMNRCSGLLFSAEQLQRPGFGPEEADFVGRNIAKAELALGDVLLNVRRQYHWSCLERSRRLQKLDWDSDLPVRESILDAHASGVEFKLHPIRAEARTEVLRERHETVRVLARDLWLWLESRRLTFPFDSAEQYSLASIDRCPETDWLRNGALNTQTFGPAALLSRHGTRSPRERLLRALALLLFVPGACGRPDLLRLLQELLETRATGFTELVAAYCRLWNRFN